MILDEHALKQKKSCPRLSNRARAPNIVRIACNQNKLQSKNIQNPILCPFYHLSIPSLFCPIHSLCQGPGCGVLSFFLLSKEQRARPKGECVAAAGICACKTKLQKQPLNVRSPDKPTKMRIRNEGSRPSAKGFN